MGHWESAAASAGAACGVYQTTHEMPWAVLTLLSVQNYKN